MHSTAGNCTTATNVTDIARADLAAVQRAEGAIRASLDGADTHATEQACRECYTEPLSRYCMAALGDASEVSSAMQQIWSSLVQEASQMATAVSIRASLLRIARRRCAFILESRRVVSDSPPQPRLANETGLPTPESLGAPAIARQLLSRLRPSEREILVLRYLSQLTYVEIAEIFGTTEADARARTSQALVHAIAHLRDRELRNG